MNVQLAVKGDDFYIIEINPRASRTVPYVSKATGVPLAKMAAEIAVGRKIADMPYLAAKPKIAWSAVKEAVLPFNRFAGVDPILGPEMKSTGEVMGLGPDFETAYWKSQIAAGQVVSASGRVFLSTADKDKPWAVEVARSLADLGYEIAATAGTADILEQAGLRVERRLRKLAEGGSPNALDLMREGEVCLVINTPSGPRARIDEIRIRSEAILRNVPIITTRAGALATLASFQYMRGRDWDVKALQDYLAM
jgi:carbamoyl-phosphate synthase large subunit